MKLNLPFKKAPTLACAALLLAACTRNNSQPQPAAGQNRVLTAPTGASVVAEPEDGQWTMPAKNYASTRFSGLEDINTSNVASLKLAWSFSTGVMRGHEAAPIVVNNTMYILTPYPNIVYAIDLTQPAGPLKWKYESNPVSSAQGVACCDVVNRGVVYSENRIFFNTLDNHTIALDANTGTEIWKTKVGDINLGESMTMSNDVHRRHQHKPGNWDYQSRQRAVGHRFMRQDCRVLSDRCYFTVHLYGINGLPHSPSYQSSPRSCTSLS